MRNRGEWKLVLNWLVCWDQWRVSWLKSDDCWLSLSAVIVHEIDLWIHVSCLHCVRCRLVNWKIAYNCASLHWGHYCCKYAWLDHHIWVQYFTSLLTNSWNVYSVWSQNFVWDSTIRSHKSQSIFKGSAAFQSVPKIRSEVKLRAHGIHEIVQKVGLIESGFKWLVSWVVHTKIFIDPNLGISISVESNHALRNSTWYNKFAQIRVPFQGVEQDNGWLLFVESGYWTEQDRDGLSENVCVFLWSAESEPWAWEVGSNDLNPIGSCWFSLGINFNFIINLSVGLNVKMVEVGLLAFTVSHHFKQHWSVCFMPVLGVEVKTVGFWVVVTHFLLDYF